jgi:Uma2 family endonuclease
MGCFSFSGRSEDTLDKEKKAADMIKEQLVTYEMYAAVPDDGHRYEIFDGKLEMMSPGATASHQTISGTLFFMLMQSCKSDYLIFHPPFDVILSKTNVLQPDMMMIHRSRLHLVTERGIEGAPDMVVEIISPGSRKRDKGVKMGTYAKFGVQEYWVIDSDTRTLEQFQLVRESYELIRLFGGDELVNSDKLPCVSFEVGEIFTEIMRDR